MLHKERFCRLERRWSWKAGRARALAEKANSKRESVRLHAAARALDYCVDELHEAIRKAFA